MSKHSRNSKKRRFQFQEKMKSFGAPPVAEKILNHIKSMSPESKLEVDNLSFEKKIEWFNQIVNIGNCIKDENDRS